MKFAGFEFISAHLSQSLQYKQSIGEPMDRWVYQRCVFWELFAIQLSLLPPPRILVGSCVCLVFVKEIIQLLLYWILLYTC